MMDQMNALGFETAQPTGNSCSDVMMAAFHYYSALQSATEGEKSHHKRFNDEVHEFKDQDGLHTVGKRLNMFKNNMKKWGNR